MYSDKPLENLKLPKTCKDWREGNAFNLLSSLDNLFEKEHRVELLIQEVY